MKCCLCKTNAAYRRKVLDDGKPLGLEPGTFMYYCEIHAEQMKTMLPDYKESETEFNRLKAAGMVTGRLAKPFGPFEAVQ